MPFEQFCPDCQSSTAPCWRHSITVPVGQVFAAAPPFVSAEYLAGYCAGVEAAANRAEAHGGIEIANVIRALGGG